MTLDVIVNKLTAKIDERTYISSHGFDIFFTTVVIIIVLGLYIYYVYIENNRQRIERNWNVEKCKPYIHVEAKKKVMVKQNITMTAIEELFESINYKQVLSVKSELLYAPK